MTEVQSTNPRYEMTVTDRSSAVVRVVVTGNTVVGCKEAAAMRLREINSTASLGDILRSMSWWYQIDDEDGIVEEGPVCYLPVPQKFSIFPGANTIPGDLGQCGACGKPTGSGIVTNGDSGDGKYVGLGGGQSRIYCWECHEAGRTPNYEAEIDRRFAAAGLCGYHQPWTGRCRAKKPCSLHDKEKCWKCGAPATRGCNFADSLVCGVPECDEHRHHDPRTGSKPEERGEKWHARG